MQLICFQTRAHSTLIQRNQSVCINIRIKSFTFMKCDLEILLEWKSPTVNYTRLLCMFGYTKFAQIGVIAFSTRTQFCLIATTVDKHTQQHSTVRFKQLQHHFRKIHFNLPNRSLTRRENVKINVHQTNWMDRNEMLECITWSVIWSNSSRCLRIQSEITSNAPNHFHRTSIECN